MVAMEAKRKIDALDVKCFVHQFRTEQYTLYPRSHLVENIGHDGSGVHCRATDRFNVDLSTEQRVNFVLPPTLAVDDRISEASRKYRSRGIGRTVMHLLRAAWHAIA
jgi:phosphopantetheine adenylyltransferase